MGYDLLARDLEPPHPRDKRQREGQPCRLGALTNASLHSGDQLEPKKQQPPGLIRLESARL